MQQHVRHVPDEAGESLWVVGDTYTFKATADDTGGSLAFFDAAVPPGSGPPPHAHRDEDDGSGGGFAHGGSPGFKGCRGAEDRPEPSIDLSV